MYDAKSIQEIRKERQSREDKLESFSKDRSVDKSEDTGEHNKAMIKSNYHSALDYSPSMENLAQNDEIVLKSKY